MPLPSPAPDCCLLYLVRHGATVNNLANPPVLQGQRSDPPLSPEGLSQAKATGRLLSRVEFVAIYSSPLQRSFQTAEQIAGWQHCSVVSVNDLREIDVGIWEGMSWEEIERTAPQEYARFMRDSTVVGYQDGESLTDLKDRVLPAFQSLAGKHLGRRVVVVAHNMVNRVLLSHVLELPLQKAPGINQDNCGVTIIRARRQSFKLLTLNSSFHLIE